MTPEQHPRSFSPRRRLVGLSLLILLTGGGTGALLLAASRHAWATVQAPGPTRPADALLLCVTAAATLLATWIALSFALSLLAGLPGAAGALFSRGAAALAPAAVRRLAAALLGASLGATLPAGTAMATVAAAPVTATSMVTASAGRETGDPVASDPMARDRLSTGFPSAAWPLTAREGAARGGTPADAAGPSTAAGASTSGATSPRTGGTAGTAGGTSPGTDPTAPDAAWTPSPPDRTPVPDPDALHLLSRAPEAGTLVDEGLVVRRGDTLWSIAARSLGPGATADEIAREWPRWHEANRHTIGNDPDLIQPGQVLLPPAP